MPEYFAGFIFFILVMSVVIPAVVEYADLMGDIYNLFKEGLVIHIKRRYDSQQAVTAKGSSASHMDAKVGTMAFEIKLSHDVERRIVSFKELAYRTLRANRLLNVYEEFEPRLKQIALDGGSKYAQVSMGLKFGMIHPKDLQTAVDLITK